MTLKISVIIPAYNDLEAVLTCLNSIQHYAADNSNIEYIVQDDAGQKVNYAAFIPPASASVQRNPVNLGFPGNCNAGAARAHGDIYLHLNQDTYAVEQLSRGWDNALRRAFEDPQVGVVGARLLFPDGRVQSIGGAYDLFGQPFHLMLGAQDLTHQKIAEPAERSWVTAGAIASRAWLWQEVGGFNVEYAGGYFEDVEYCCEVRERGMKIMYEPGCTFIHKVGTTGGNPRFGQNAMIFKRRWVDTRRVPIGEVPNVMERFWAR